MKISAVVPVKYHSRRLPNKNFLRFGEKVLAGYIFETLLQNENIDHVFCFSSDKKVLALLPPGVEHLPRDPTLDGDEIRANELFRCAVESAPDGIIILAQIPSPFIRNSSINAGIEAILSGNHDSALSVVRHQTYAWFNERPINYDPQDMVQTQHLDPLYTETSGFYIFKRDKYLTTNSRIGDRPALIEVSYKEGVDIDEPRDFLLARALLDVDIDDAFSSEAGLVDSSLALASAGINSYDHYSFDLDGVLVDSLDVMRLAWSDVCVYFNLDIPFDHYADKIGHEFMQILHSLGIDDQLHAAIREIYDISSRKNRKRVQVYPGIYELLNTLKSQGKRLTVVTSKPKARAAELLTDHFANTFDCLVTPDDVGSGRGKPNPDTLMLACVSVGVSPKRSVYVGDMRTDRMAAEASGVAFIYAGWGFEGIQMNGEQWFPTPESFAKYLASNRNQKN